MTPLFERINLNDIRRLRDEPKERLRRRLTTGADTKFKDGV